MMSLTLSLQTSPDNIREQLQSLIAAKGSLTITNADKENIEAVIDIFDNLLELSNNVERRRAK